MDDFKIQVRRELGEIFGVDFNDPGDRQEFIQAIQDAKRSAAFWRNMRDKSIAGVAVACLSALVTYLLTKLHWNP